MIPTHFAMILSALAAGYFCGKLRTQAAASEFWNADLLYVDAKQSFNERCSTHYLYETKDEWPTDPEESAEKATEIGHLCGCLHRTIRDRFSDRKDLPEVVVTALRGTFYQNAFRVPRGGAVVRQTALLKRHLTKDEFATFLQIQPEFSEEVRATAMDCYKSAN